MRKLYTSLLGFQENIPSRNSPYIRAIFLVLFFTLFFSFFCKGLLILNHSKLFLNKFWGDQTPSKRNQWIELNVSRWNKMTKSSFEFTTNHDSPSLMTTLAWYDYERPRKGVSILTITPKAAINGGIQTKRWRRLEISCVILTQGNWIWYWASKGFTRKRDSPSFTHNQLAISYVSVPLLKYSIHVNKQRMQNKFRQKL